MTQIRKDKFEILMFKIRNGCCYLNNQSSNKNSEIFYIQLSNNQQPRMFRILVIWISNFLNKVVFREFVSPAQLFHPDLQK